MDVVVRWWWWWMAQRESETEAGPKPDRKVACPAETFACPAPAVAAARRREYPPNKGRAGGWSEPLSAVAVGSAGVSWGHQLPLGDPRIPS